jgi:hypothetical protein
MFQARRNLISYHIDLRTISLADYRETLRSADLLPSRIVLKDDLDRNFAVFQSLGLNTVEDLRKALNTKKRLQEFSSESGLPEGYLAILIREIRSLQPKPNKLSDFPETSAEAVDKLAEAGIKHTAHLYEYVQTPADRAVLAARTGVDEGEILRLARLSDLSRIRWINHTAAYVLLEAGYSCAADVAGADPAQVHEDVNILNEQRKIYNAHIGLHDMALCVAAAKDVPRDMVF